MNWGTFPEWLSAIAAVASAGVVIWLARLNWTNLKELNRSYQMANRKTALNDSDPIQRLFDQASRAIETNSQSLLNNEMPLGPTNHSDDVMKACFAATRLIPSIEPAAVNILNASSDVTAESGRIRTLEFEQRKPQDFAELQRKTVAFNTKAKEFMEQFKMSWAFSLITAADPESV